jgi:hypothetical protein
MTNILLYAKILSGSGESKMNAMIKEWNIKEWNTSMKD